MSNVITFPGRNPAQLGNPSFACVRAGSVPPENDPELEQMQPASRRRYASMLTYTFRSYDLIVESSHAELVRDVRCDIPKAATKLRRLREQIQRDREHATAREAHLTKAEAKLAAAIAAAHDGRLASGADAAPKSKADGASLWRLCASASGRLQRSSSFPRSRSRGP